MGIIVGILNGFLVSIQNTLVHGLPKVDTGALNSFRFAWAVPILAILITIFGEWQIPPLPFFLILIVEIPLEIIASFCYIKAYQLSPQSLVGPLFSLSVIFLVPLSFFVFGDIPSLAGWSGIILGIMGSFFLGWDSKNPEIKKSLNNILSEKGTYYMLGTTLIVSMAIILAKLSFTYASPLLSAFYVISALMIFWLPNMFREIPLIWKKNWRQLIGIGVCNGIANILHYIGLSLLPSAYYISLKRSAVVFDVILGKTINNETHFRGRLIGASLMLIGIFLVAIA